MVLTIIHYKSNKVLTIVVEIICFHDDYFLSGYLFEIR